MRLYFFSLLASLNVFLTLFLVSPAQAKTFRNAYVSFELPPKWECVLEGTEWVCRSDFSPQDSREAIIILTAKEVGPTDTMAAYAQHLNTPRTIASRQGQPLRSQVIKVATLQIANQPWVDGMHLGSEIPNYYTRYMATIRDRIAILVTFSAHKTFYAKYSNDFLKAINSLRVTVSKGLLTGNGGSAIRPGAETLGANIQSAIPADIAAGDLPDEAPPSGSQSSDTQKLLLAAGLLLGAGALYLWLKRRR